MPWLILIFSGALEAVWAAALHRSKGFRRPLPSAVFLVAVVASTGGLAVAMQSIPTGTAYAVWVGVGVVLTATYAMVTKVERATTARLLLLAGIGACVVGLKVVA
ncbi:multidrug efflux SMR transporter [Arthrobacter sp. SIMBA_036]|uniref:DMT family transporter n=1 Tax=Arthrobacter sp. SIMBA_036 TaxID=3085778 RepID=UPI00397D2004